VAVSAEENRAPLAADDLRKIRLTFDGEQLRLQTHMMGAGDLTGLYVLSPAKSPKEILLVSKGRPTDGTSWNLRGIYRIDKDRLTICLGTTDQGPIREFKTLDAASPRLLLVLRREAVSAVDDVKAAFRPLFNGKDLDGWEKAPKVEYKVRERSLI